MIARSTDIKSALRSRQRGFLLNPHRFGDPYYSSVSLLLHGNGTNGSTTFTDNSPTPKTVTVVGNAQISTTQSKFGGAAMYFDGTGDYLTVPNTSDFAFGTGNFTVEAWVYPTVITGGRVILTLGLYSGVSTGIVFYISDGKMAAYSNATAMLAATASVSANVQTHVAWVRSGTTLTMYSNGVDQYSITFTSDLVPATHIPTIGRDAQFGGSEFTGYIDDLRVTKGVARYTANFTPPTAAFPDA